MTSPAALAEGVRRVGDDLLVGADARRVLRLSASGREALDALLAGRPHPRSEALRTLLHEAGMLELTAAAPRCDELTVVVPARARAAEVLVSLAGVPAGLPVVVVDDGGPDPLPSQLPGLRVLRRTASEGPAAARNRGAREVATPLVAFVDTDVELPENALDRLTGHFADPKVVAVAPRVVSRAVKGWTGVLEQQLCALDLGTRSGLVGRSHAVPYVPSTVLLVRRSTFVQVGGFNEALQIGEDVDLVWRLSAHGQVRYDATVVARHGPRRSVLHSLRRRAVYGTSVAPLDARHPGQLRHLQISVWSALPWLIAVVHPAAGVAAAGALVALAPRGMPDLPPPEARRLAARGQWAAFGATGRYALRPAAPLTGAALWLVPRTRRLFLPLAAAYLAGSWSRLTAGPRGDVLRRAALCVADDLAYSSGVWVSAVRHRRPGVLLPALLPAGRRRLRPARRA